MLVWAIAIGHLAAGASLAFWFLVALWTIQSFQRAKCYTSAFEFWGQAWKESPRKSRVLTKYAENVLLEIERQMKAGKTMAECDDLISLGTKLVEDVAELGEPDYRWKDKATRPASCCF